MRKQKIQYSSLLIISLNLILFPGCVLDHKIKVSLKAKNIIPGSDSTPATESTPFNISIASVQVINHQIVINGTGLEAVKKFHINEGSNSADLSIESATSTKIIANTLANVSFSAGKIFDFILSNASASSTFNVNFSLCDSQLNGSAFNCTLTPNDQDVLTYETASSSWIPKAVAVSPWTVNASGNAYRLNGNVGIGTTAPTSLLDINGTKNGTGTIAGLTTITGVGTKFTTELNVGDIIGIPTTGDERVITAIASDTSLTISPAFGTDPGNVAFIIRKKVSLGSGNTSIGTNLVMPIAAGAGLFGGAIPKLEISTGTSNWQTFSELVTIRHTAGAINTGVTRQLGVVLKMSNESSSGESAKMGGMILESTQTYANNPFLSLMTQNARRLTVDFNGKVGIGTSTPTSQLTVTTTAVSGNIANFVSTGTGGAGCSIAWNGASCSSDIRLKENIETLTGPLEKTLKLRSVSFNWKKDANKQRQVGYIAQEIEKVFPEVVKSDDAGFKQVNYANLVSVATGAIKELFYKWSSDSEALHREIASLKENHKAMDLKKDQEINDLKARLEKIEKNLNSKK